MRLSRNEILVLRAHAELKAAYRKDFLFRGISFSGGGVGGSGDSFSLTETEYTTAVNSLSERGLLRKNKLGATQLAHDYTAIMQIVRNAEVTQ